MILQSNQSSENGMHKLLSSWNAISITEKSGIPTRLFHNFSISRWQTDKQNGLKDDFNV